MLTKTTTSELALPAQRQAGVCLHMTSLPGPFGIGEIGDAALAFVDSMARMNLRVWQFLPTGPTAFGDSPYQPLSTFAGNELLIDTATLVRAGLLASNEADTLLGLPAHSVDYGRLIPKKKALLDRAAGRFHAQADSGIKSAFDRFLESHDEAWLHDYALFRILKTRHGERPWPEWAPPLAHREQGALRKLEADCGRAIESIKIIQFLFHRQWQRLHAYAAERGVLMFGDMPIYIALDSSDAWANRDIVCLDQDGRPSQVAGVPPDYFSEDGQLWGNPLYDWKAHAADGYGWWIERLQHSAALADLVRIDHFRGFEAYWSVPAGAGTARVGEWIPGPGAAIFDAMRAALGNLPIVAEDLGVITPAVEALRDRYHIPGMKVLQFEVGTRGFDLGVVGENCVCYTGTHDNDTSVGWFLGSPDDNRSRDEIVRTQKALLDIGGGNPETPHEDLVRLAFSSRAKLAIAPLQDYLGLGSEARFNTPGTSGDNWRWRVLPDQLSPARMDRVGELVDTAGRSMAL
ncbi:MAG: 4-alpha-glucanotransferase [Gammaproteobacteria bacterium]|nr:4-alpha-glucanotransferase [Gammaproteobacteria bacterium]MDH4253932.1 4-alpha-glucanotransferase [Gammaproteobacteria bacterium]MDH5309357.1 4-alpha-glucanotransferase [Gammaproteobacteria bacterium]